MIHIRISFLRVSGNLNQIVLMDLLLLMNLSYEFLSETSFLKKLITLALTARNPKSLGIAMGEWA